MNTALNSIAVALLAITVSQQTVFAQEFVTTSRQPSFDHFTQSLEGTSLNMARSYDDRVANAARNHYVHNSASNLANLLQSDQSYNQSATSQFLSSNSSNQGPQNQGNNQGNNGFFGGGFPGGVGLPYGGIGGGFASSSLFGPGFAAGNPGNGSVSALSGASQNYGTIPGSNIPGRQASRPGRGGTF